MVKPFAPVKLVQRLESIARVRMPFSVASSYIEPDRRNFLKLKVDEEEPFLIEVPNTIGMKSRGERIDTYELLKSFAGVMTDINDARLK
tara:strand:+ start:571 stop:837 length:267 start_codon:yes stop_codon:yes gene_type:complete